VNKEENVQMELSGVVAPTNQMRLKNFRAIMNVAQIE
jgi:hypothetical protein